MNSPEQREPRAIGAKEQKGTEGLSDSPWILGYQNHQGWDWY